MSNRAFDPELMQQAQSNANRGNDCEVRLLILSCSISLLGVFVAVNLVSLSIRAQTSITLLLLHELLFIIF